MQLLTKILLVSVLFGACKNKPATPSSTGAENAAAILKHKYWVSKNFHDALFATNIADTISYLPCGEILFNGTDTLILTSCLSDAGRGTFKATGANTLSVVFEGFEDKPCNATLDEKTGILHIDSPAEPGSDWPTEFVAHDAVDAGNLDNVTINLGRERLAGKYSILPQKGEMAIAAMIELHADGTQTGFGDFDLYEPWLSGIGGGFIQNPPRNLMYLVKKGQEENPVAVAWQVRGDTLKIWDTKNTSPEGDLPEYKVTKLRGTYLKGH